MSHPLVLGGEAVAMQSRRVSGLRMPEVKREPKPLAAAKTAT
jgi:hypothetical protein